MVGEAPLAMFVCPYCGSPTPDQPRCVACRGFLDPLSRQASQNAMGPWFIRNPDSPFQIGCSYETITAMVSRGRVTLESILRGPTTSQFWSPAKRVPGVAHLLGVCHNCGTGVDPEETFCPECRVEFWHDADRQYLGLMPLRAIPGQPLPVAAEHARVESRVEASAAGTSSDSAIRNIEVLEGHVRWLWGWLIGVMAVLGVVVAVVMAGVFGGFVTLAGGGSTAGATGAGPEGRPSAERSDGRLSEVKPGNAQSAVSFGKEGAGSGVGGGGGGGGGGEGEKRTLESANPASLEKSTPDASQSAVPTAERSGTSVRESEGVRKARALIVTDTEESLAEAIAVLEPLVKNGDAGAAGVLQAARARLAQKSMRGVR